MNVFEQLGSLVASPHHEFEEVCARIIGSTVPDIRRVAVWRGDGGVDLANGEWGQDGDLHVYQVKYFESPLKPGQKSQIKKSFETAKNNPRIKLKRWTLCLPCRLTQDCQTWFDKWKKNLSDEVEIQLLDGDALRRLLEDSRCASARQLLTKYGVVGLPGPQPLLTPRVAVRRAHAASGYGYVLVVTLSNSGDLTAQDITLKVTHTDTKCAAIAHNHQTWNQKEEMFASNNPFKGSARCGINPGDELEAMKIGLRANDEFPVEVYARIGLKDNPVKHWLITVNSDDLRNGREVAAKEVPGEVVIKAVSLSRPEPVYPLAKELLLQVRKNPDSSTKGLTVILRNLPGSATLTMVYYSIKGHAPQGEIVGVDTNELEAALTELQNLSWFKFPTRTPATLIYPYLEV